MKKSVLTISAAAVCVAALSLGACSCNKKVDNSDYDKLGAMLNANYSQINLTVTETFDASTSLESNYVIKYSESEITVEYTVQRFSSLSLDNPSTDFITVYSGTAVISNGAITGGEEVGLTADIATPKFNFNKSYFENAALTGLSFNADVKNVNGFWGLALNCTDMKVSAEHFFYEFFYSIEVSYTQNGNKIEYIYEFSR